MSRAPTVLIVDPQPATRAATRRLLERSGFEVSDEAADADGAIELAERVQPDLCLIDVLTPGGAIGAVAAIAAADGAAAVVVLTESDDPEIFLDAIRAGAVGYLPKDMNPERLPHALRGVLDGESAMPRTLVALLVSEMRSHGRRRLVVGRRGRAELTRREWEVAQLLVSGADTAAIAGRLFLSPVTVRRHISGIVGKLGVADRRAAIALLRGDEGDLPRP